QRLRNRLEQPTRGPYDQLWVTTASESGLRRMHLIQLQYPHIKDDLDNPSQQFIYLKLPDDPFRKTTKTAGYTFIGPASRRLIQEIRTTNPAYLTQPTDKLFPFTLPSINEDMANARDKANIQKLANGKSQQPNHALRRFFK